MHTAEDAPQVLFFDEPALAAAQQWMHDVLSQGAKGPPNELFKLFRRETTVHIVNQANAFSKAAFSSREDSMQCIQCVTTLYNRVLHMILLQQPRDEFGEIATAAVQNVVSNTSFQIALLACIAELVSFAATGQLCFPSLTARLNALSCIVDMWEALLYVQHYLVKMDNLEVPDSVQGYLGYMRVRITEEVAWMKSSPLFTIMAEGGGGTFRPGDTTLLQDFLVAVSQLAMSRAQQAALSLIDRLEELALIPTFVQDCLTTVDAMLMNHLDLLFNQHLSRLVSCCVYGTTRMHNVVVSIKRVNQVVAAAAPHHGMELFQADGEGASEDTGEPVRDIRQLYNDVFLPRMRAFLQQKEQHSKEPKKKGGAAKLSRLPLRSLSAKDVNSRPQPEKKRLALMR